MNTLIDNYFSTLRFLAPENPLDDIYANQNVLRYVLSLLPTESKSRMISLWLSKSRNNTLHKENALSETLSRLHLIQTDELTEEVQISPCVASTLEKLFECSTKNTSKTKQANPNKKIKKSENNRNSCCSHEQAANEEWKEASLNLGDFYGNFQRSLLKFRVPARFSEKYFAHPTNSAFSETKAKFSSAKEVLLFLGFLEEVCMEKDKGEVKVCRLSKRGWRCLFLSEQEFVLLLASSFVRVYFGVEKNYKAPLSALKTGPESKGSEGGVYRKKELLSECRKFMIYLNEMAANSLKLREEQEQEGFRIDLFKMAWNKKKYSVESISAFLELSAFFGLTLPLKVTEHDYRFLCSVQLSYLLNREEVEKSFFVETTMRVVVVRRNRQVFTGLELLADGLELEEFGSGLLGICSLSREKIEGLSLESKAKTIKNFLVDNAINKVSFVILRKIDIWCKESREKSWP